MSDHFYLFLIVSIMAGRHLAKSECAQSLEPSRRHNTIWFGQTIAVIAICALTRWPLGVAGNLAMAAMACGVHTAAALALLWHPPEPDSAWTRLEAARAMVTEPVLALMGGALCFAIAYGAVEPRPPKWLRDLLLDVMEVPFRVVIVAWIAYHFVYYRACFRYWNDRESLLREYAVLEPSSTQPPEPSSNTLLSISLALLVVIALALPSAWNVLHHRFPLSSTWSGWVLAGLKLLAILALVWPLENKRTPAPTAPLGKVSVLTTPASAIVAFIWMSARAAAVGPR